MRVTAHIPTESIVVFKTETMAAVEKKCLDASEKWLERNMKRAQASMRQAPFPGEPSEPGEPPHVQSGSLRKSLKVRRTPQVVRIVGNFYGFIHESGGSKHPARPFIRPQMDADKKTLQTLLKFYVGKGLKAMSSQIAYPTARQGGVVDTLRSIARGTGASFKGIKKTWGGRW